MAQAPVRHNHDEPAHKEPAKIVGQSGSLVLLEAEAGGPPLVGARGVKGEHIEDGERDPDTIAEEQRRRSAEYEAGLAKARVEAASHSPPPPKK